MTRRIVTGHTGDGKATVVQDGPSSHEPEYKHTPGFGSSLLWATPAGPSVPFDGVDPVPAVTSHHPEPGETRLIRVTFPPASVFMSPDFDGAAAAEEQLVNSPGLAERFEPDNPGMHTTDSVDYGVLLSGEIVLELDAGETVALRPGDVVVQNGTRHAWRNPGGSPATMLFVLIGAQRIS